LSFTPIFAHLIDSQMAKCAWCGKEKYGLDMVLPVESDDGTQVSFCSLNCLSLYRVKAHSASNQLVLCDHCKLIKPDQCRLTMSDGLVRNFCSIDCVNSFQQSFVSSSSCSIIVTPDDKDVKIIKPELPATLVTPAAIVPQFIRGK
jgi:hypothetical protein